MKAKAVMADKVNTESSTTLAHRVAAKADRIKFIVLAVVVIAAAAIIIFTVLRNRTAAREAAAENALYQAEIDLLSAPETDAVSLFGKMATDYKGMTAGARALIMQFGHAFNTREYATAETAAREFIRQYPDSMMIERARLSLGQAILMQGKTTEAIAAFRELVNNATPEILPEAKLALAQALERYAEEAKDTPDEYRTRLQAAEAEYNDIIVRSQVSVPSQRGFWPQAVTLPADFALVVIKDKLAGYEHASPRPIADAPLTDSERESAALVGVPSGSVTPPSEEDVPVAPPAAPATEENEEATETAE